MFDIFDHDSTKDLSKDRVFDLGDNKIHARCTDPYGFWHLSYEKGKLPEDLTGVYTSFYEAERAVTAYLKSKGKEASLKQ